MCVFTDAEGFAGVALLSLRVMTWLVNKISIGKSSVSRDRVWMVGTLLQTLYLREGLGLQHWRSIKDTIFAAGNNMICQQDDRKKTSSCHSSQHRVTCQTIDQWNGRSILSIYRDSLQNLVHLVRTLLQISQTGVIVKKHEEAVVRQSAERWGSHWYYRSFECCSQQSNLYGLRGYYSVFWRVHTLSCFVLINCNACDHEPVEESTQCL